MHVSREYDPDVHLKTYQPAHKSMTDDADPPHLFRADRVNTLPRTKDPICNPPIQLTTLSPALLIWTHLIDFKKDISDPAPKAQGLPADLHFSSRPRPLGLYFLVYSCP